MELSRGSAEFLSLCGAQGLSVGTHSQRESVFAAMKPQPHIGALRACQSPEMLRIEPPSSRGLSRQDAEAISRLCLEAALYRISQERVFVSSSSIQNIALS